MTLYEKWMNAVETRNTVLCAGVDPAPYVLGRGEKGLPKGKEKRDWTLAYLEAVAPFCTAVKPNLQYWKAPGDTLALEEICQAAGSLGLIVIEDSKIADIGPSNDAGIYYTARRADAVTFSPFAGNTEEACRSARAHGIGIITMCLMSNPEYCSEKNKLVKLGEHDIGYLARDVIQAAGSSWVPQYIRLVREAADLGADGVVVGAPSDQNHITREEILTVSHYLRKDMLILAPGIGAQGGEAGTLFSVFGENRVIVNVGRALMLPKGSRSTPEDQAAAAKEFSHMLNTTRQVS